MRTKTMWGSIYIFRCVWECKGVFLCVKVIHIEGGVGERVCACAFRWDNNVYRTEAVLAIMYFLI